MTELNDYWSAVSQIVLVLGFALVTEVRRSARRWSYTDRKGRYYSAALHLLMGLNLLIILAVSMAALSGDPLPGDWQVPFVQATLPAIGGVLILNPIVVLVTNGTSDLYVVFYTWFPFAHPARVRRSLSRRIRSIGKQRYQVAVQTRETRAIRDQLRLLHSGAKMTRGEASPALRALAKTVGERSKTADVLYSIFFTEQADPQRAAEVKEFREQAAVLAEAAQRTTDRGLHVLKNTGTIVREMRQTLSDMRRNRIPAKIDEQLRQRFERAQADLDEAD